jgi:hypothetical protein
MLTAAECLLKAENYAAAARLDPSSERLSDYLRLAALWRARAIQLRTGGKVHLINEPPDEVTDDFLWH